MLLAADVGNTEIVLGVFRGPELVHTWRISTQAERTADEQAAVIRERQHGPPLEWDGGNEELKVD